MEIKYKNRRLEQSLTDPKTMVKTYGNRAKKVNQRLKEIKASATLAVLKTIPAAHCHQLSADRDDQFAVDISANFRMILEPDYDPIPRKDDGGIDCDQITAIKILEVKDYH
ncbi:MAG: type II toxin-antitoxin system RelE/ParE family toxin [Bacteroidota bacterium]